MSLLPSLTSRHALFLDFDGTVADIAPRPDAVRLAPGIVDALRALQSRLEGALAIVTGRPARDIDALLAPLRLPLACEHGAQYRWSATLPAEDAAPATDLAPLHEALRPLLAAHPALVLETKRAGLALHYRQAPQLEALCHAALSAALAQAPALVLQQGKCVIEVRPADADKGRALAAFLARAPFAGRQPVFLGDDATDEAGFVVAQACGGVGVKVGAGATCARLRVDGPAAVRAWLLREARKPAAGGAHG
ncbi:MAG: trehalose-phosphatase [Acidovorax sp.]|nr:trehalose-phosphatase [Acidovorax sp.]